MRRVSLPTHKPPANLLRLDATGGVGSLQTAQAATKTENMSLAQQTVSRKDTVAKKRDALRDRIDDALVRMQLETQITKESVQFVSGIRKMSLVIAKQQQIVRITDVANHT